MTTTVTLKCSANPVQVVYNGREITDGGASGVTSPMLDPIAYAIRQEFQRIGSANPFAGTVTIQVA